MWRLLLWAALTAVLVALLRPRPTVRRAARRPVVPADWDPWQVLGIERGATSAEIARAYRDRMKEYHPDRVAGLGAELRELAHRKTLDIQRAWDELQRADL